VKPRSGPLSIANQALRAKRSAQCAVPPAAVPYSTAFGCGSRVGEIDLWRVTLHVARLRTGWPPSRCVSHLLPLLTQAGACRRLEASLGEVA